MQPPILLSYFIVTFLIISSSCEHLVFYDDFHEFDLETWQHELTAAGGGNWEFQYYTNNRSNSYVRDGILYIKPTLTAERIGEQAVYDGVLDMGGLSPADECTGTGWYGCFRKGNSRGPNDDSGNILNPIQSARIRTSSSFYFKYGRMEVRAKMPRGDWLWPAIWLLPRYNSYGAWPCSGEIDIIETRGNGPEYEHGGVNSLSSTIHWGPNWMENAWRKTTRQYRLPKGTFNDEFHIFGMKWDQHGIYTYLDDESNRMLDVQFNESFWNRGGWKHKYDNPWEGRGNAAPFDQKFYIILNVAVGGVSAFFPDDPPLHRHRPNATATSNHTFTPTHDSVTSTETSTPTELITDIDGVSPPPVNMLEPYQQYLDSLKSTPTPTPTPQPLTSIALDASTIHGSSHPHSQLRSSHDHDHTSSHSSSHPQHRHPHPLRRARKPWSNKDPHAVNSFYRARSQWYPTWHGEDAALQIDWIRVWQ